MQAILKRKTDIAADTMRFDFEVADGRLDFKAGQFISLSLPEVRDDDGNPVVHYFSICSTPANHESFSIATRMSGSRFKKWLKAAAKGSRVEVNGPDGDLVLPKDSDKQVVMVAGGIGITPFRSMLKAIAEQKTGHKAALLYSNKNKDRTAFYRELDTMNRENDNIEVIFVMTDDPNWQGPSEKIDDEFIKNNVKDYKNSVYLAAGPPGMVRAMANEFDKLGLGRDQRTVEEFMGY